MLDKELQRIRDGVKAKTPFVTCTARALARMCADIDVPKRLAAALAKDPAADEVETDILIALDRTVKHAGSGRRELHVALLSAEYLCSAASKSEKPNSKS